MNPTRSHNPPGKAVPKPGKPQDKPRPSKTPPGLDKDRFGQAGGPAVE